MNAERRWSEEEVENDSSGKEDDDGGGMKLFIDGGCTDSQQGLGRHWRWWGIWKWWAMYWLSRIILLAAMRDSSQQAHVNIEIGCCDWERRWRLVLLLNFDVVVDGETMMRFLWWQTLRLLMMGESSNWNFFLVFFSIFLFSWISLLFFYIFALFSQIKIKKRRKNKKVDLGLGFWWKFGERLDLLALISNLK